MGVKDRAAQEIPSSLYLKVRQPKPDKRLQSVKASDKKLKKDVKGGECAVSKFLGNISPYEYEYKSEKHGKGKHTSVMAQDLEKSELGAEFIEERKDGKYVDYAKAAPAMMAALAHLNKEIKKLKKKK